MKKSVLTNNLDEEKLRASEEVVDALEAEMEQIIEEIEESSSANVSYATFAGGGEENFLPEGVCKGQQ